jgi:hypothetical protein
MKRILTFVCAALILSVMAFMEARTTRSAWAATLPAPEQIETVPLFVLQNDGGFFFYTIDPNEMATLQGTAGWHYIGIGCYVLPNNKKLPGSAEVYRLVKDVTEQGTTIFNQGAGTYSNHFYTTDHANAKHAAISLGWRLEGIPFYVSPKEVAGTVPLYRFYRPYSEAPAAAYGTNYYYEQHILTTDKEDKANAPSAQFVRIEGYVWTKQTALDAADGLVDSGKVKTIDHPAAMSPMDQLFSLGCSQNAGNKQISCPTVRGWDTCNFYKNKGEIKVSFCTTTMDQFAFANMETDLTSRSCKRYLGRAGEYICMTLNGDQACQGYLKKKDGLVTKCLSVKQDQMEKDLYAHGCRSRLGRADDFYCSTEGMKTCENYRIDGRVKICRPITK